MGPMGWCHEFGMEIEVGCGHPMVAGSTACSCAQCGTQCNGRFEGGCEAVWSRAPRPNAPGRPSNYTAKAMFEPTVEGSAPRNGAVAANGRAGVAERTPVVLSRPAPRFAGDVTDRLARMETALTELADLLARQSQRQATMERHLADLGKVLGHLGVETEERLGMLEGVLDGLTAPPAQQVAPGAQGPADAPSDTPWPDESAISLVVPLRPVSDEAEWRYEVADLDDDYRARRSP